MGAHLAEDERPLSAVVRNLRIRRRYGFVERRDGRFVFGAGTSGGLGIP
ncbi:MAG: hypothetical protein QOJ42_6816 [Acidobacteriaceae bacterium]|nr:hypothetical protein [Acidobacteriaceae bacterium]MEA3007369.1 hypothetical protein [Acidobacteriaceae bacterium]